MKWQAKCLCQVFVREDPVDKNIVWAFYSLSASSFIGPQIPVEQREGMPERISIPMVQLGYMGRFNDDRLSGIGGALLYDAARRAAAAGEHAGIWGIWLEPENEALQVWYAEYGFHYTTPDPKRAPPPRPRMFCTVAHLLESAKGRAAFP